MQSAVTICRVTEVLHEHTTINLNKFANSKPLRPIFTEKYSRYSTDYQQAGITGGLHYPQVCGTSVLFQTVYTLLVTTFSPPNLQGPASPSVSLKHLVVLSLAFKDSIRIVLCENTPKY